MNSQNRCHGRGYVKFNSYNLVAPKTLGMRCLGTCKQMGRECESFSDAHRKRIFDAFYDLSSLQLQREFICRPVEVKQKSRKTAGDQSRRTLTYEYYLTIRRFERKKVCKNFFLSTLAITERMMRGSIKKVTDEGTVEVKKRGGRVLSLKERDAKIRRLVNSHIDRFPRMESHFCRANTDREYLSSDLSLTRIHKMFCDDEDANEGVSVSRTHYLKLFRERNLSFHHPKKDQCSLCNTYRTGDQASKERLYEKYISHIREKQKVREIKKRCKEEATKSSVVASLVFDLEQVFSFPMSQESLVFYKRRLSAFNFTIYDLASKDCDCFYWTKR